MGAVQSVSPLGAPVSRVYFHDNILHSFDPSTYKASYLNDVGAAAFAGNYGGEDLRFERNTVNDQLNKLTVLAHYKNWGWEGSTFKDNYFLKNYITFNSEAFGSYGRTATCSDVDKTLVDCALPGYVWSGMVVQGTATTMTPVTFTTTPGFVNASLFDFGWAVGSMLLTAGTTGGPVRADYEVLARERGDVNAGSSSLSASAGTITATVPDSGGTCTVGYGTGTDPSDWSRVTDTATLYAFSKQLTGLAASTTYYWQLWCAGTAPTTTASFATSAGGALSTTTLRGVIVRGVIVR